MAPKKKNGTWKVATTRKNALKNDRTCSPTSKKAPEDIFEAVAINDENAVKRFVEVDRISLQSRNYEKQTAAHVAAQKNRVKLLKYLLKKDSSVLKIVDHYGNNVLFWTIQKGSLETVEYLVDSYELDVSERVTLYLGNSALHVAAEHGRLNILKYLVERRYGDVNTRNDMGESPLFSATDKTQMRCVKYLVEERNANVTMTDDNDDNVLYRCAKTGELVVAKYLLDERKVQFDMNHRNKDGRTLTFTAAMFDNLDLVKYFVQEKHADINIADEHGRTPLHEVADVGRLEMVQYLVERGANLDARDLASNKTARQITTDDEIKVYLKKMTPKRSPRSVSELGVRVLPNTTTSYLRLRSRENGVQTRESEMLDRVVFSKLDVRIWLAIANICIRFLTAAAGCHREQNVDQSALMSPPEILRRRTDPLALEAVISFPNSVKS